jgi:alanyl-tRNA synthetase
MTEALYYDDPRLLDFEARALAVGEAAGAWSVELDRTAFYPEGGGQPADRGILGGAAVLDVRRQGERVVHVLAARPHGEADRLSGRVDWSRRWDFMQQHTGQHLLSSALLAVCGAPTVSVHLGDDVSTIELDVPALAERDLEAAEDRAAELIAADLPVVTRWVDDRELARLALRRPTERRGRVRLVEIGEVDRAACGGLHVGRTAEVQLVRLAAVERIRGRLRTHWKIGRRALLDFRQRSLALSRIGVELSSGAAGVVDAVIELKRRLGDAEHALEKAARREARAVADRLAAAAERSGTVRVVTAAFTGEGPDFLRRLARELVLVPDAAFCLTNESEGRLHWAIGTGERSGVDPAGFLGGLLVPIAGKGGGKPPLWQGVGSRPEGREALFAAFTDACRPAAAK